MDEKPYAGFMTALLVVPLVVVCCAGPVVLVAALSGLAGWLGGLNAAAVTSVAIAAGLMAYGLFRWRSTRACRAGTQQVRGRPGSASARDNRLGTAELSASERSPYFGTAKHKVSSHNRVHRGELGP